MLRFAILVTASPAMRLRSSVVIVERRKGKSCVATGKTRLLYALSKEDSTGKVDMSAAVCVVGKYLSILILYLVYGYASSAPIPTLQFSAIVAYVVFAQTFRMWSTHLQERMSSSIIRTS